MKKWKPEWEHASVEVSAHGGQPYPCSLGSPRGICSGSKPGSKPIGTTSPSGGAPDSQCSPHKCAWAWELGAEGPASSSEASSFASDSLSLCFQQSRHLSRCRCFWSNMAAVEQAFLRSHNCPPGRAAGGAWPSPGSHFWQWPAPWLQQPPAT